MSPMFLKLVEQLPSRGFGNSATSSHQKMHNSTLGPSYSFGPRDLEDKQDFLEKLPVWDTGSCLKGAKGR